SGFLGEMTRPEYFDVAAITDAGNISAGQMQSGFWLLRPTLQISKWVTLALRAHDPEFRKSFAALEAWAGDNVAFPAAAYRTYIEDLYQGNALVKGQHHVGGVRVDLSRISCPVLTVIAEKDTICPPPAALALNEC